VNCIFFAPVGGNSAVLAACLFASVLLSDNREGEFHFMQVTAFNKRLQRKPLESSL
jgi:hypothetical protein